MNQKHRIADASGSVIFSPIKASGSYLYNDEGKKVLDFSNNFGSNVFCNSSQVIEKAIISQIHRGYFSQSCKFYSKQASDLSKKIRQIANFYKEKNNTQQIIGTTIFSTSATEANECAIAIARRRYNILCERKYNEIICFEGSNHGNSLATISAGRSKENIDLEPLLSGFKMAKLNNLKSVEKLISEHTCAVIVETVQYNNGIVACDEDFLQNLRKLCSQHEILLILDETHCGCGRSGAFFAYEKFNVKPDILTIANGLAGGFPLAACVLNEEAENFSNINDQKPFGGNSLLYNIADSVIQQILDKNFLQHIKHLSDYFKSILDRIAKHYSNIIDSVQVNGLMLGMKLKDDINHERFSKILLSNGLACETVNNNTILFFPQLDIDIEHINEAAKIITISIDEISIIERY